MGKYYVSQKGDRHTIMRKYNMHINSNWDLGVRIGLMSYVSKIYFSFY